MEKRNERRQPVNFQIFVWTGGSDLQVKGLVINISKGGLSFFAEEPFSPRDHVMVRYPHFRERKTEIKWAHRILPELWRVGVRFT